MNLSKKYYFKHTIFLFILLFLSTNSINSDKKIELYRSNSNGLALVKITSSKLSKYKYILRQNYLNDVLQNKILFKNNKEDKKWEYNYSNKLLSRERYYKKGKIEEEYRYDSLGHKIKQIDYNNNKQIRFITYKYNKQGLVEKTELLNLINNKTTFVKYKYDETFRINQIEKDYPDGRVVYWEAIFSSKGIIIKEFYTLQNEEFSFIYNESGQELTGEVKEINKDEKDKIKLKWNNYFSTSGKKSKRIEFDYLLDKKTIFWYNENGLEKKIETYYADKISTIEKYEYNEDNNILKYIKIKDLNKEEIDYFYDKNNKDKDNKNKLKKTKQYNNDILKKETFFNENGNSIVIVYSKNNKKILIEYDKDENIISQTEY